MGMFVPATRHQEVGLLPQTIRLATPLGACARLRVGTQLIDNVR